MKSIFLLVMSILLLLAPTLMISAQDETFDISYMMIQDATSGTLTDNGDETFTLLLSGVPDQIAWFFEDSLLTGFDRTSLAISAWTEAEELVQLRGALTFLDGPRMLTLLSNPEYDALNATMTYSLIVVNPNDFVDNKGDVALPETFDALNLFIIMDDAEFALYNVGFEVAASAFRNTGLGQGDGGRGSEGDDGNHNNNGGGGEGADGGW